MEKLFTPSNHDSLPGMPIPGTRKSLPSKDNMADYLENYSKQFSLPVKSNVKVNSLSSNNNHFEIDSSAGRFTASRVVIATGTHPFPYVPEISKKLSPDIYQIHSSSYKSPESLPEGDVLVVGAGISGIEIALEVAKTYKTFISGKPTFHLPNLLLKYFGELWWVFVNSVLTTNTPVGRKARKRILHGGGPLVNVSAEELEKEGIMMYPRLTGSKDGMPQFSDGSSLKVSTIIWSTGFKPDFSWIKMNVTDETGWPVTKRGVSSLYNNLYFVGMPFQFGLTSGLVGGVGRDAEYVSRHILQQ
jgi:putative flavoprotein involved in K+ transport